MEALLAMAPPAMPNDHADAALGRAVAAMHPGWVVLRGCVLGAERASPARVRYALLHAQVGVALLDVVPGPTSPHAADCLRRRLDAAGFHVEFGRALPILYLCVPLRALPDTGRLLEHEFGRQPASALPRDGAWVAAVQGVLSAQPLERGNKQAPADGAGGPALRRHPHAFRPLAAGRRFGGGRWLAVFWSLVTATVSGGALLLQALGPPEKAAKLVNTAPLSSSAAEAEAGAELTGAAPSPIGADLQRALIENDRAITEVQRRLERFEHGAEAGTTAPETSLASSRGVVRALP